MASTSDKGLAKAAVTSGEAQSPPSDNDSGERPVRKQLKETTIESAPVDNNPDTPSADNGHSRKRSFEESRDDAQNPNDNSDGSRKRSRENTPEDTKVPQSVAVKDETKDESLDDLPDYVSDDEYPQQYLPSNPLATIYHSDAIYHSCSSGLGSLEDLLFYHGDPYGSPEINNSDEEVDFIALSNDQSVSAKEHVEVIVISDDESVSVIKTEEHQETREPHAQMDTGGHVDSYVYISSDEEAVGYFLTEEALASFEILRGLEERSMHKQKAVNQAASGDDGYASDGDEASSDGVGAVFDDIEAASHYEEVPSDGAEAASDEDETASNSDEAASDGDEQALDSHEHAFGSYIAAEAAYDRCTVAYQAYEAAENACEVAKMVFDTAKAEYEAILAAYEAASGVHGATTGNDPASADEPVSNAPINPLQAQDMEPLAAEIRENDDTNNQTQGEAKPIEGASSTTEGDDSKAPKKKRSREQLEEGAKKPEASEVTAQTVGPDGKTTEGEPEKKRHRDNSQERDTKTADAFAASAFANTSATSPFASLGKTANASSTSAFAASSLAAFAGSEKSPFGTLGAATNSSVFKPTTSGTSSFGPSAGTSGFGALGSGFAGVGGGFASASKPGGLTSFASSNAPTTSQAKPLGADESEGEESETGDEENATFEAEKTDDRFFEQTSTYSSSFLPRTILTSTVATGEEEEETAFSCKAKLFHFSQEWKERGIGTFKLNIRTGAEGKRTGRMIMRADGAGRVMLNSPIFKGMNYGDAKNQAPKSKQILLACTEEGRTVPLLLRTGNEAYATELYEIIGGLLEE
ncbi:hypothetical protein N7492_005255 [Penicillium capsulatum]|uniref:RanBD1 domain-containing protein n=1 Tax=Penicillium capsulatum TaxID=69766 RepID=A0A9W9LQZ2_9EURO|nr:hypothetical protein N7492_005255 [Penicillium capsulatum]KAJ6135640.1 hypothetical protein N7512_000800 [Penicillium capsulatum]